MSQKTILVITDGIGYSERKKYNAFEKAVKPNYDYLFKNIPYGMLDTHGLSVGLPKGQMGNSEVGHMGIGSGRVLYQDLVKISLALEDGSLAKDKTLLKFIEKKERVHLFALCSDGGVHSHISHIIGMQEILEKQRKEVILHLFGDGRDVKPGTFTSFINEIKLGKKTKIGSISGRFFAMDRDNRWERVELAFNAIAKATPKTNLSYVQYLTNEAKRDISDEFVTPTAFDGYDGMKENDCGIFVNFRSDRAREIVTALSDVAFKSFDRGNFKPLQMLTMTVYDETFSYPTLFRRDDIKNTLAEVLSKNKKTQLHTAETEKYAHVTFFFNGGIEEPYPLEDRIVIPSPKVKSYDMEPKMSAVEVGKTACDGMKKGYDFIVVNFANGDMVGHTGVIEAGIKAVEAVDAELGKIIELAKANNYALIITSDHGNCEEMADDNGEVLTNHTAGVVWCFIMKDGIKKVNDGTLANIAPTVLKFIGLEIPQEMEKPLV